MNKKGQVSVFIIIGIIIIIGAGIVLYMNYGAPQLAKPEEKATERSDLAEYVYGCLEPAMLNGLEIMRLQGGYIDIPSEAKVLPVEDLQNKEQVVASGESKVVVKSGGPNNVAFWLTDETILIPTIDDMQLDMKDYIQREFTRCIGDFGSFKELGFEVTASSPQINVTFEEAATVRVIYPITMKRGTQVVEEEEFVYTVPVNLKLIHDIAGDILVRELQTMYLEEHSMNWISMYGTVNGPIPPVFAMTPNVDCSYSTWDMDSVTQALKAIFYVNNRLIKIEGTDYERIVKDNEIAQGVIDGMIINLYDPGTYLNVRVDHEYRTDWFSDVSIKPFPLMPDLGSTNQLLFIPLFCIVRYNFKYTVDYPVLVTVTDYRSAKIDPVGHFYDDNEGYSFQFPMWVVIAGNNPREPINFDKDNPLQEDVEDFIQAAGEEMNITVLEPSPFCEEKYRVSKNLTIRTFSSLTKEPISKVQVYYYCGSYVNDCLITESKNTTVNTKFPLCVNGELYFNKKGYDELRMKFSTYDMKQDTIDVYLHDLVTVQADVKKVYFKDFKEKYNEPGFDIKKIAHTLSEKEMAIVTLTGESPTTLMYPTRKNLTLVPGTYKISIMLMSDTVIAPGTLSVGETNVDIDPLNGKPYKGQFPFGYAENIPWTVEESDFQKKHVTFYVFTDFNPEDFGWGDFMTEDEIFSHPGYERYLTPTFD